MKILTVTALTGLLSKLNTFLILEKGSKSRLKYQALFECVSDDVSLTDFRTMRNELLYMLLPISEMQK